MFVHKAHLQCDLPYSIRIQIRKNGKTERKSLLTSFTFLVCDEHGSWLHLQLRQRLVQLNRFTIVDQISTSYKFWFELLHLLLQFCDGIDAPHSHRNLHAVRAIEDIHWKAFKTW